LENFRLNSPHTRRNLWSAESCGIFVNVSSSVKISQMQISTPADHGIFIGGSRDVTLEGNTIEGTKHHGVHIQSASQNIHVTKNTVRNTNGDGLSVIDWGSDIKSKNIKFLNNIISGPNNTGIRVGTAEDVEVRGNKISKTFHAGIQMQCAPPNGNGLTNVLVTENEIVDSPRENSDNNRWASAIVGTTNLQILEHIHVINNIIINPRARTPQGHETVAIGFSTANEGFINDLNIIGNKITDDSKELKRCVNDLVWFSIGEFDIRDNSLNGGPCPETQHK